MSSFVILPSLPVPFTVLRSSPRSAAIFRTAGAASTFPPPPPPPPPPDPLDTEAVVVVGVVSVAVVVVGSWPLLVVLSVC